jgi:hypothetical protein
MRKLNIALDYDGTYTEDPELWDMFIRKAREKGHKVYIVTMRCETTPGEYDEVKHYLDDKVDGMIFTNRKAKAKFCWIERGMSFDIWIDDNPQWVVQNAS